MINKLQSSKASTSEPGHSKRESGAKKALVVMTTYEMMWVWPFLVALQLILQIKVQSSLEKMYRPQHH
jgi:hypothetical protein